MDVSDHSLPRISERGGPVPTTALRPAKVDIRDAFERGQGPKSKRRLAVGYLSEFTGAVGDAECITDKALTNYLHLGLIALLLPRAKVVHCRRDVLKTPPCPTTSNCSRWVTSDWLEKRKPPLLRGGGFQCLSVIVAAN